MLIDSHIHIGKREECEKILETSEYRNLYKIYSCINPKTIDTTESFIRDVDKFFAIPLFFCETNIENANQQLLDTIKNNPKAIPILLLCRNEKIGNLIPLMDYNILKEHFTLHLPDNIKDRDETYSYLNDNEGFLLLHTLSSDTYQHTMKLRKNFPKMKIIVAHLGRNGNCDVNFTTKMIENLHKDENIFTDISTITNPELIRFALNKFGKQRILYGSDFPFEHAPGIKEKDYLTPAIQANLLDDEYDHLFYKNAEDIIKNTKIEKRKGKEENFER